MKLLAAISQHGLGHLAQAAPVLNALRRLEPAVELTIWSGLAPAALRNRITGEFNHRHAAADVGLLMHDAMQVDLAASHAAYCAFHADWPARVLQEADWIRNQGFDLVFSIGTTSVFPYIAGPVVQASQMGIPTVEINPTDTNVSRFVEYKLAAGAVAAMRAIRQAYQQVSD